jgi:hypothetical protein
MPVWCSRNRSHRWFLFIKNHSFDKMAHNGRSLPVEARSITHCNRLFFACESSRPFLQRPALLHKARRPVHLLEELDFAWDVNAASSEASSLATFLTNRRSACGDVAAERHAELSFRVLRI